MNNDALDMRRLLFDREIDARVRSGRDDMISIMLSENRRLEDKMTSEIKRLEDKIDQVISMRKWGVGIFVTILLMFITSVLPNIIALIS